jgi:tetratricopeptide (TPR) repeat protein
MAEGLLGGILGEEDEKPEVEPTEALASADAFAAAIAAKLAGNDPGVARKTEIFLDKHAQLLELQAHNLRSEHHSRLHFLQGQAREVDLRLLGLRLRVGFQMILALAALAIAAGFVIMVRDAVASRSVVIEPIEVAQNVSAQVPNGKILAAGLLDILTKIQAANHSGAERRALSNGWTSEISIELPETGISFGQIERLLKTRFGHDQHIDGDLVQSEDGGLGLTVRGTGILPQTFTDKDRHLDKLLLQAAEYVYGQSQPGLWTSYLANNGRTDDAIQFAQTNYATVAPDERPYLLNYWANALAAKGGPGSMQEALIRYRAAIRLKPDYYTAYSNVVFGLYNLGQEEQAIQTGEQMKKVAGGRPGRAPEEMYQNYDQLIWDLPAQLAEDLADLEAHSGVSPTGAAAGSENLQIALVEAWLHNPEDAAFRLKTISWDEKYLPDVAVAAMDRATIAEELGDLKTAVSEWSQFAQTYHDSVEFSNNGKGTICSAAVSLQRGGLPAQADAALDATGDVHYVDCYRFRGDVLDLRGDWAGAQEWYAKAVQLAPSIPSSYYSWGVALIKHGSLDAAIAKLKEACDKSPHWADPLKAWGDALVKQGKPRDALAKYDAALKLAPHWKALMEARDAAGHVNS